MGISDGREGIAEQLRAIAQRVSSPEKAGRRMGRTLKDSFVNLIEYVTYRQKKDREFCVLCPFI